VLQSNQYITNYSQYDPTMTTSLRNAFSRKMNGKFNELIKVVRKAVVDQDCFGLKDIKTHQMDIPPSRAFAFARSQDKIEIFMLWLKRQVDKGVLSITEYRQIGTAIEKEWTDMYVYDSYKRGVMRARMEMVAAGMAVPSIAASGGIEGILSAPFHIDRVGILFTRTFTELQGVTDTMASLMSRVLAQGMIDGDNPYIIARKLRAVIDGTDAGVLGVTDQIGRFIPAKRRAEMIARTEIIRAFNIAKLQEYKNWGVLGISVKAEWRTVLDDKVCPQCASMEGEVFPIEESWGLLPAHPNCRCTFFPVFTK